MPEPIPPLRTLQQAITDRLDADAWFDRIPIVNQVMGDWAQMTDIIVGKKGTCVVVQTPSAEVNFPDLPAIYFDQVPVVVSCYAHAELNKTVNHGTGIEPLDTAQVVAALLHNWLVDALADANGNKPNLIAAPRTIIPVDPAEIKEGLVGWDVYLIANLGCRYTPQASILTENNNALLTELGFSISKEGP